MHIQLFSNMQLQAFALVIHLRFSSTALGPTVEAHQTAQGSGLTPEDRGIHQEQTVLNTKSKINTTK